MAAPPPAVAGRDPFAAPVILPEDRRPSLPHSLDAEESVIGGCIIRNDIFREIHLSAEDFYDPRHQAVWRAMAELDAESAPIDETTIASTLQANRKLAAVGGRAYIDQLALRVPTADNARHYAGIVADLATRRNIMQGASRLIEYARHADIEDLQAEIARLDVGRVKANGHAARLRAAPGTFDHALEVAVADIKAALANVGDTSREPLFEDAASLFDRDYPATPWLVTGLISRGGVAITGGEPKESAKTWIQCEMAVSVATGTKVFGEFFAESGIVAYFFAEDRAREIRNRVRALLATRGLEGSDVRGRLHVCPRGKFLDITKDEDLAWVVASARQLGHIDMLVLDPLRDVHGGEEDKSDSMRDVMRRLRLLGELLGCTVAVTHHMAKVNADTPKRKPGQRLRGSSAIHGSIDSGIYISPRQQGGDGRRKFALDLNSQVKGARSAGWLGLGLEVDDDEGGEAVRATWTIEKTEPKPKTSQIADADDQKVFEFVRSLAIRGEHLSRTKLREHDSAPIAEKRMRVAIDRMLESGKLLLESGKIVLPGSSDAIGET